MLGFTLCLRWSFSAFVLGPSHKAEGELSGLVTDPTGAVVAGATVKLTNPATKEIRTTTTTAAGIYTFPALAVGSDSLGLSPKGFRSVRVQDIVVSVGGATTRDVKLKVGARGEQVMVEAGAQTVQTTASERIADGSRRFTLDSKRIRLRWLLSSLVEVRRARKWPTNGIAQSARVEPVA